jgi:hypothetical protein
MTQVNDAIVTQTAAKIASELVASIKHENLEQVMQDWEEAFSAINDSIFSKIGLGKQREPFPVTSGRNIPVVKSREEIVGAMDAVKAGRPVSTMKGKDVPQVRIVGKVHGEVPAWLHRAAAKAGVTEVWDNRESLKDNPKRPWFVSADDNKTPFWAPKGLTSADIPFGD